MSDVEELAKRLTFLPVPARSQFAAGLFDFGVRVHPELVGKPPNSVDKLNQCVQIAKVLRFLPPGSRKQFATGLFDFGVRVHPDLATCHELIIDGRTVVDAPRPRMSFDTVRDNAGLVRKWAPELADKMEAATTEDQKQQVRAEIEEKYSALIGEAKNRAAAANYEAVR